MSAQRGKLIVLAAGGTGGHLFPAQALAHELLERGDRPVLVTDTRGGGFGPELAAQVPTHRVAAAGIIRRDPLHKAMAAAKLAWGYLQARRIVRRLQPDAVVGFGSYAALPTVLASAHAGTRVILHEQNAVAGRANRLLARRTDAIATAFPEVRGLRAADRAKTVMTGNPVRAAIAAIGSKPYAVPNHDGPLRLLVTGGSQGARAFNEVVPAAVARLPESVRSRLQIAQQVRSGDSDEVRARYDGAGVGKLELRTFFDDMPARLQTAHLVIARSGASTVTELAAAGRPAILVPYPFAADDHQTANAEAMVAAGAAWLLPQATLSEDVLAERLGALFAAPDQLVHAAGHARAFGQPDSAKKLADLVTQTAPDGTGAHPGTPDREAAA
ncbi:UDP-N-acetylglucosamine-N-acetylmuramylpentapeptide N-acetylglucosamine transferase [Limimonas halophila]|uniref:UDP-N-acetylglucosamine--N-acetylmuramyl-(pentapeptide) pyrophosphoryl-undecaprenol N-acetylglucosamine transferase n=1 Tax=Limimonas halophila TaxID=1082479 RepID=A0A1G7U5N6_9PROT|nr:undecaprenyldiphospho-muramoylpentapeptide beta-N-acetylglucosaminyltransferase [Limimonas halophila]SDG42747.1 UDP-N-acetylglucosamine-N-acetylmuramylpentapeptide N-acetylglucosamine transferase [Limimonas halophila]